MTHETARREIESLDYYLQNHADDYSEESHTAMMMAIQALEQEPTGHWIRQTDDYRDYYECEYCGIAVGLDDVKNFCPNCGAKMQEVEK